ncbi:hypothetical protein GCM10011579_065710 [Streptomyces albiflavescens]|uniref:Uncharacterized protein n=1 Tax=Streptomyces albiflavescens TaxID=1623582 RepID=A0A917YA98_9ACTN|nr:hypothetical protein GCM10011579_065710 [Streptomyces albiflavescens]
MVDALWYIAVTTVLSQGQFYVERHDARGSARAVPPMALQRLKGHLAALRARLDRTTAPEARRAFRRRPVRRRAVLRSLHFLSIY